jgi:hypothetical protein
VLAIDGHDFASRNQSLFRVLVVQIRVGRDVQLVLAGINEDRRQNPCVLLIERGVIVNVIVGKW